MGPRQLRLVFAETPRGGGEPDAVSELTGEEFLRLTARASQTTGTIAPAADAVSLDEVASLPNLARALLHVARNQGAAGVDGKSVEEVTAESARLLPQLRKRLLDGSYAPGDVKRVWIPKPGGGQRGLGIPNVVDRCVQQATLQVLERVYEPTFHPSSHGFRPQRGAKTAIAEAKAHLQQGRLWVVGIDLSKFFDRVNHQRLLSRMAHRIHDGRILKLVHQMLKAAVVLPDGTRVVSEEGTPQGGPLSPLLSNIVLDELDWEMARRGHRFVRYADDFNVYVGSERAGHRVMQSLTRFIEGRLRLKVNVDKSTVAPSSRVHFLGFCLVPQTDGEVAVQLSARTVSRMNAKIRELTPRLLGGSLDDCIERLNRYLNGWVAYFGGLCTAEGALIFARFDAHIRRRLRALIIRQKKRPRTLFRHLIERNVSPRTAARTAFRKCGIWKKSNLPGITRAYRNAWFHERITTLGIWWKQRHGVKASQQGVLFPELEILT